MAGNPYHDAEGQFCSRDGMQAAVLNLGIAGDLDGYFKLRTELEEIDKTNTVKKQVKSITATDATHPDDRAPLDSIILNDNPSWEPAVTNESPGDFGGTRYVGSKFEGRENITETAKKIRADIKEAVKGGYLPAELEYNVTTQRGNMSSRLDIVAKGLSDKFIDGDRTRYTPEAAKLVKRLDAISSQYNSQYSGNYDQSQYSFYGFTELESEHSKTFRIKEKAAQKRVAASRVQRKEVTAKIQADSSVIPSLLSSSKKFHDGSVIGKVKDSNLYVMYAEVSPGKLKTYKAWDLTYESDGGAPETESQIFEKLFIKGRSSSHLRRREFKLK